jgi:sensor histidine kinase regulating citrate/malate metabolism
MISALTGVGLGPVAVGFVSDQLSASLGTESLRWSMALCSLVLVVAGMTYLLTARRSSAKIRS